jgi:hypothetical protein
VFVDRLVATLIHLRHDLPHSVLSLLFGVEVDQPGHGTKQQMIAHSGVAR